MINPKFFASSSLIITVWRLRYKLGEGSSKSTAVPESTRQDSGEQNLGHVLAASRGDAV